MNDKHDSSEDIRENWIKWMTDYFGKGWLSSNFSPNSMWKSYKTATTKAQAEIKGINKQKGILADKLFERNEDIKDMKAENQILTNRVKLKVKQAIKMRTSIKELEQAAITKSETYQSALENIHKELECCGNCGARVYGTFDCGLNNILCEKWKQKRDK